MRKCTLKSISNNEVSFYNNDFRVELNNRNYEITAIHGVDSSTKEAYSKNPNCVMVSLIELNHKLRGDKHTISSRQMIESGLYLHCQMLNENTLFEVISF